MLRNESEFDSSVIDLIKTIKINYFQPFIESLKKSNLSESEIIKEVFRYLQLIDAEAYFHHNESKRLQFLHDFENATMNDSFKKQLLNHPDLKENFIHLGFLYLVKDIQKQEFPGFDTAEIQTCIRELFHDYLNPLPQMQIKSLSTVSISDEKEMKGNGALFKPTPDLQNIIYSYLDYESIFSFKKICKSSYFLHKKFQDKKENILYLIADDVKITRPRGILEFDLDIPLRRNIPENEIIDSLCNTDKKEVKVFKSLYQALEYSHYLHHGGHILDDSNDGYMPSLWVVTYVGNHKHLNFTQEKFVLYEHSQCSAFDGNRRNVLTSYAIVPKHSVQPLLGAVIFSYDDFASYKTFNLVDFKKCPQKENDKSSKTTCSLI